MPHLKDVQGVGSQHGGSTRSSQQNVRGRRAFAADAVQRNVTIQGSVAQCRHGSRQR